MRSFLQIVLFYLLITQIHYPQWTNQNPVPDGNDLWSTFFVDDSTIWIVGSEGFIKKTTNMGLDWIQQNSGTTHILKSVQFVNQSTGWICGESGLILKTTDGGQNWINQTSGITEHLTDIHFFNLDTGYVTGLSGALIRTTNGGSSWTSISTGTTFDLNSIDFVDAFVGYAVGGEYGSYAILKTTDGGLSWVDKHSTFFYNYLFLLSVEFTDVNTGFIGGGYSFQNVIYKTTDGGETWVELTLSQNLVRKEIIPNEQTNIYKSGGINYIYFNDSNIGYAAGGNSDGWDRKIYTTTDGGSSWTRKYIGWEESGLISVSGNSQGRGLAVGFAGAIFITENNGSSWEQILSGNRYSCWSGDDLYSVFCINENVGWAVGYRASCLGGGGNIVLKTTNGGKIWKTQLIDQHEGGRIRSVHFINEYFGWAVGDGTGPFYLTTDGGENWIEGGSSYSSVFFIDQETGWATDDEYNTGIYKSTDSGITWVQKNSISSSSVYFIDINTGWAVGEGGSMLKSTDGGESWLSKTSGTTNNLNSIKFYNSNLGMCVGNAGTVLLSTDGGESWIFQNVGTVEALKAVSFANSNTIWIAGSNGTILQTTDLNYNWLSYQGETENDLTSICFVNEHTGWVCGMNGTIFKYDDNVVPVELVLFTAHIKHNTIELKWRTATEINNSGFEIERRIDKEDWKNIGFVEGHGNISYPNSYSFTDRNPLGANKFQYRLKQLNTDGSFEYSDEIEVEIIPTVIALYQNYPNPFNPSTVIGFSLPEATDVSLTIYNTLGQKVTELVNGNLEAGHYNYQWNASNITTGMYIYELRTDNFISVKKMLLMK